MVQALQVEIGYKFGYKLLNKFQPLCMKTENKKLYIKTYGCQMNEYDSTKMADVMLKEGFNLTQDISEADMVILNTCHIREKASEKVYSELGRILPLKNQKKSQGKNCIIAVAGCTGQAEGAEIFNRASYVDIVVGPQSYHKLPSLVKKVENGVARNLDLDFIMDTKFDYLPEEQLPQGVSANLSIQEGCDKFCHFCVVPYTRGAEFSRPLEEIYREAMRLVAGGAKEITLLGQNVNAYHGLDYEGKSINLGQLIKHIANIPDLDRIRYMTSHPNDMHDELYEVHANEPKLMPYMHLPIQSGSDKILKAMNRKHTTSEYMEIIKKLRSMNPNIALSSDFIVGYPGETEEDFADTLDLIRNVNYAQAYSFKYSPRPGTPAAEKLQIDEEIKNERLVKLQALLRRQQKDFNNQMIGKTFPILLTKKGRYDGQLIGKTPYLQSVYIELDDSYLGKIIDVNLISTGDNSLKGELI